MLSLHRLARVFTTSALLISSATTALAQTPSETNTEAEANPNAEPRPPSPAAAPVTPEPAASQTPGAQTTTGQVPLAQPPEPQAPAAGPDAPAPASSQAQPAGSVAVDTSAVSPANATEPSSTAPVGESEPAAASAEPTPPAHDGFRLRSTDGSELEFRGLLQADGRFFPGGAGTDTFAARRVRLDLRAKLASSFGLRLHVDLSGSVLTLLDAYATITFAQELELQAGKMKSPLGLEVLQSPLGLLFPERGLPSLLVPNRDVGVVLQGKIHDGLVSYAAGVFNGAVDGAHGDVDEGNPKDLEGRVFFEPLRSSGIDALAGLGAGVSISTGDRAGALPSYRTSGRQTFLAYDAATADGRQTRVSPQGYYYFGPVGVLGEYVSSKQEATDGSENVEIDAQAWQVWGSVVIGGKANYKGAKLDSPFDPDSGTWGALELALRYGDLRIGESVFDAGLLDETASARGATNLAASLSWWLLTGTRAMVAFDHTSFDGGADGADREAEDVIIGRLQLAL